MEPIGQGTDEDPGPKVEILVQKRALNATLGFRNRQSHILLEPCLFQALSSFTRLPTPHVRCRLGVISHPHPLILTLTPFR